MVRIRLRRTGKKKQPSYRVVVADSESPRDGRFIENIGFYNPRTDPPTVEIDADRALYWLSQGAQPSDPVARLLRKEGILAQPDTLESSEVAPKPVEPVEPEEEAQIVPEAEAATEAVETEQESAPEAEAATEAAETEQESAPEVEAATEAVETEQEAEVEPKGESVAEKD